MRKHDDRYDQADEYLELALRFWQTAWDDGAVEEDREAVRYADPDKVHGIEYSGEYYRSAGWYATTPSPQRTPVLFQAGTSARGRAYAAHNAECVFVQGTTVAATKANVADIRARAAAEGRDPESIRIMVGVTVTVGETHEAAVAQRAEFDALQTDEVVNVLYSGNTGIDLLSLDPDRSLEQLADDGTVGQMGQSNIDRFLPKDGSPAPTVREILDQLKGRGTRGFQVTGSVTEVADELESPDGRDRPRRLPARADLRAGRPRGLRRAGSSRSCAAAAACPRRPSTGTLREQLIGRGAAPDEPLRSRPHPVGKPADGPGGAHGCVGRSTLRPRHPRRPPPSARRRGTRPDT